MIIRLKRFSYGEYETEGILIIGSNIFATIEQPWTPNPNGAPGGKPFESCVPDGMYALVPFTRPNKTGDKAKVYILSNPDNGVFKWPGDHDEGNGRDLCLIHQANWARQIQGCVAPGLWRKPMVDPKSSQSWPAQAVSQSGKAMKSLRELLGEGRHVLSIENDTGARDV